MASKDLEEVKEQIDRAETVIFGTVNTERVDTQTKFLTKQTHSVFLGRLFIEVAIPVLFAIYSCFSLVVTEPHKSNQAASVQEAANKALQLTAKSGASLAFGGQLSLIVRFTRKYRGILKI